MYDDSKGMPGGKQSYSERSKSYHDERLMYRVLVEERICCYQVGEIELRCISHGEEFFICSMGG